MTAAAPRQRRRLTAADRRRQLLHTAAQILDTQGSDGLSLPRLALAAGVTKPVVYEHFRTRAALFAALVEEFSAELFARLSSAVAQHPDDIARAVRAANQVYLDYIAERGRGLQNLFASVAGDPAIEAVRLASRRHHIDLWVHELDRISSRPLAEKRAIAAMFVGSMELLGGRVMAGLLSREAAAQLQEDVVLRFLHGESQDQVLLHLRFRLASQQSGRHPTAEELHRSDGHRGD